MGTEDDIYVAVLYEATKHSGLFKTSQFKHLHDAPTTHYGKTQVMEYMMAQGWMRQYKPPDSRVYIYQITERGRVHLEEHI